MNSLPVLDMTRQVMSYHVIGAHGQWWRLVATVPRRPAVTTLIAPPQPILEYEQFDRGGRLKVLKKAMKSMLVRYRFGFEFSASPAVTVAMIVEWNFFPVQ